MGASVNSKSTKKRHKDTKKKKTKNLTPNRLIQNEFKKKKPQLREYTSRDEFFTTCECL
jgi:hypothetical protein